MVEEWLNSILKQQGRSLGIYTKTLISKFMLKP